MKPKLKALTKLAKLLRENADNPHGMMFDLDCVLTHRNSNKFAMDCGTVGCAIGLAAVSGQFKGLTHNQVGTPHYKSYDGMRAGRMYFGLDLGQANRLFYSGAYRNLPTVRGADAERAVAKRILAFVRREEKKQHDNA